jgi:hypothetical protein
MVLFSTRRRVARYGPRENNFLILKIGSKPPDTWRKRQVFRVQTGANGRRAAPKPGSFSGSGVNIFP